MGGRLSKPRGPERMNEVSTPRRQIPRTINARTLVAPLAAVTMACLLFVYSRTSIHAARLNAQKHREADGGQLNWRNESLRRHGQLDKVDDKTLLKEALLGTRDASSQKAEAQIEEMKRKPAGDNEPAKMLEEMKSKSKRNRRSD